MLILLAVFLTMNLQVFALGDPNFVPANPPVEKMLETTSNLNQVEHDEKQRQHQEQKQEKESSKEKIEYRYDVPTSNGNKEDL